jgi:hypothetical protein
VWRVDRREEDVFLIREILGRNQAALRAEREHVTSPQAPKDALERHNYEIIRFEDETGDRPSLVGA